MVKSFCKAKSTGLIMVDEEKICESVRYIVSQRNMSDDNQTCSFENTNCVHSRSLQVSMRQNFHSLKFEVLGKDVVLRPKGFAMKDRQLLHVGTDLNSH